MSDETSLEARVNDAFTPNERDRNHLAGLDIREAGDLRKSLAEKLRRLLDGTTELP